MVAEFTGIEMSFKEDVADLAKRAICAQTFAKTDEVNKNAIVMPRADIPEQR